VTTPTSPTTRARPGTVAGVTPQPLLTRIADLIRDTRRPEIADVTVTDTWCVMVRFGDGAGAYIKVCHTGPTSTKTPERPSWPGPNIMPAKSGPRPPAEKTSMRASYFADWLRHQLAEGGQAPRTFAEVGAVGIYWPPLGLVMRDGDSVVYLSIVGTSPDGGTNPDLPLEFEPTEDAHGQRQMSSL